MKKILLLLAVCLAFGAHAAQKERVGKYGIKIPPFLVAGDSVAILSPGSTPPEEKVDKGCEVLRGWGLVPVRGKYVLTRHHMWAGTAKQRTEDLMWALKDPSIKAIICTRGGYGASQILYETPLDTLKKYNKWIVGYSDITALHSAMVRSGHMSVHGSMLGRLATTGGTDAYSQLLRMFLFGEKLPAVNVAPHQYNHVGKAKGILIGGNMSVFSHLAGSKDYDFLDRDFLKRKDVILFFEDVSEPVAKIASMLFQLKLKGVLDSVKGIVIGRFDDCKATHDYADINEMLNEMLDQYNIPICYDFPTSHDENYNTPLIEGCQVELKVTKNGATLKFKQ